MGFIIQESVIERVGCVLLILLHHTCSGLEVTVPSSHVALFQTRTLLPCTFTVNNPPVNPIFLAIFWYFEGKQLLRYDNKDKDSSPGVSINEQELKRGNASLSIHNVTVTDQGTYKCLVIYSPERQHKEIQLNILAVPTVGMNKKVLLRDERNLVQCSVTDFFPRDITVRWLRNGQDLGSASEKFQMNADGTYNVNSSVTISPIEAKDNPVITCQVEHESLRDPLQDAFREEYGADDCGRSSHFGLTAVLLVLLILACGILMALWYFITKKKYFQRFQVSHIHREPIRSDDEVVTLYCVASNCTTDVVVTWTVIEKDGGKVTISDTQTNKDEENVPLLCSDYTVSTDREQSDNLYNVITALRFKPDISRHKDMEVMCNFLCDGKSKERRLKCSWTLKIPEMSAPIKLSLCDSRDVLCSVTMEKFYPRNIQIKWSCGVGHYQELDTAKNNITSNSDYTCNAVSECRVPGHLFKDPGFRVRVMWSHQSLDVSEHREVSVTDFPWCPVMDEIIKPPLVHGTEAKLQCTISGYFPGDLDVKWVRREAGKQELYEVSPSDKYKIPVMEITQQSDKTYTCTTSLIVSVSVRPEHGSEFICRVTHPTLVTPLEKRTGELSVTAIPTVNVTHLNRSPRVEILNFFPKDITVAWSRTIKDMDEKEKYKEYQEKYFKNTLHDNKDETYTCISKLSAMPLDKKDCKWNKSYKVTVNHETLKCPIEKIIVCEKGEFYLKEGETRTTEKKL